MYCIHKWGNIHIAVDTLDTREHINTHKYAQIRIYMYARTKCAFTYIHTQARQTKHGQENTSGACDHCDCNITYMQPTSTVSPHTSFLSSPSSSLSFPALPSPHHFHLHPIDMQHHLNHSSRDLTPEAIEKLYIARVCAVVGEKGE